MANVRQASMEARQASSESEQVKKDFEALIAAHCSLEAKHAQQSEELARMIGHQNHAQKIQHHVKIKDENNTLKKVRLTAYCSRLTAHG